MSCQATARRGQRSKNSVYFCNIGNRLFSIYKSDNSKGEKNRNLFTRKLKKGETFFVTLQIAEIQSNHDSFVGNFNKCLSLLQFQR